jgi:hypothetical protein
MNFRLFVTAATIAIIPVLAQAQTRPPKPTVADVENVFKIISSDKAKTQAYCDLNKIEAQLSEADEKKDTQKVAELGKKADDLANKIGPEYVTLMAGLEAVEPDSPEGKTLQAAFAPIEKLCP